jgi:hypothetical protein
MNIEYVLIGSDENPYYLDFWPLVSKVWKEIFNVTPVLGLIGEEDSDLQKDAFGLVKRFKKIDGVDAGLQSQIVRFYLANHLNGKCLISDIDMLPLSVDYFEGTCSRLNETNLIIHSADNPECLRENMYPMCYVAGHSEVFKKIFELDLNWGDFCKMLSSRNQTWYTDQKFLFEKVNEFKSNDGEVILLKRGWRGPAERRIDRINWTYDPNKVKEGYYIDSHLLRPVSQYQTHINSLINLLY